MHSQWLRDITSKTKKVERKKIIKFVKEANF